MKILVVDDSAIIRTLIEQNLPSHGDYQIVASASNGKKALELINQFKPDLIISDYDMPIMDGLELCTIVQTKYKIPVIILCEDENIQEMAITHGASLFLKKPKLSTLTDDFWELLSEKISHLGIIKNNTIPETDYKKEKFIPKVLIIGSSTGGPSCIVEVAKGLGENFPLPVLLVQHIEIGSDKKMVNWFNSVCPNISFKLATDGEKALPGKIYMAPADFHLEVSSISSDGLPIMSLSKKPEEHFLRPAVNVLFRNIASLYKNNALAVLLTGMGRDGAEGCKAIVENGGYTIAEDKSTCIVFGMPAAAIELGAAKEILPRFKIGPRVLEIIKSTES